MTMYNPSHPGEILKELYINSLGLTLTEVAIDLGVTRKTLSMIVNGKSGISPEMSLRLSKAFGNTNPEYWMNLQTNYELSIVQDKVDLSAIRNLVTEASLYI